MKSKDLHRRLRFIEASDVGIDDFIQRTLLLVILHNGHRAQIRRLKQGFPAMPWRCPACKTKVEDVHELDYRWAQEK